MLTKILCFALISAVVVQSRSLPGPTNEQDGNQDLHEPSQPVQMDVNGTAGKKRLNKGEGGIGGFLTSLHDSAIEAIDDAVHNFAKEINSIVGIGNATLNAVKTIIDAKAKIIASIPKAGIKALGGFSEDKKKQVSLSS